MIVVYRVQDREGRGPYRPRFSHYWTDPEHDARNPLEPTMMYDPRTMVLRHNSDAFGYAFRTPSLLLEWFSITELHRLAELNYYPVTMLVDRVLKESPRQLIFWRNRPLAVGVRRVPLHSLHAGL